MGARKIKQDIIRLLRDSDLDSVEKQLVKLPSGDAVNALFSGICRSEEEIRWPAISAMGVIVAKLAAEDMEAARVIMRRLLWSLNDESGGIGWGAPEAMAEIMCRHEELAEEYVHMLLSYMRPDGEEICQDGNFLEHETLQQGVMWAAGQLARCRRQLVLDRGMEQDLFPYLDSPDAVVRGLAARAGGLLGRNRYLQRFLEMREDDSPIRLYEDKRIKTVTVAELAVQALRRLKR